MQQASKKKLVVVTWFSSTQPGFLDFSYRIRTLAGHYDITVISRAPIVQDELLTEQAQYLTIPAKGTSKLDMLRYQHKVSKAIKLARPDGVVLLGSQLASMAMGLHDFPTVVYWNEHPSHFGDLEHGNPIKRSVNKLLFNLAYRGARSATLVLPIGEAHRDDLIDKGVASEKVVMIYMGVHPMFQAVTQGSKPAQADGKIRLIYTGSVAKARGRDVMLEGLALANSTGSIATLTIVGASEDQIQYCKERASELGIVQDVTIIGRVPGYEIPEHLRSADFGICIWEDKLYWRFNPPTKLFEYLAAGLPVLASNIRTHTQYITHGSNGFIFDYSAEAFAAAIATLINSPRPPLIANALSDGKRHAWPEIENQFIAAMDRALTAPKTWA